MEFFCIGNSIKRQIMESFFFVRQTGMLRRHKQTLNAHRTYQAPITTATNWNYARYGLPTAMANSNFYALCSCHAVRRYVSLCDCLPSHCTNTSETHTHTVCTIYPNGIISLCTSNYVTQTQNSTRLESLTWRMLVGRAKCDLIAMVRSRCAGAHAEKLLN